MTTFLEQWIGLLATIGALALVVLHPDVPMKLLSYIQSTTQGVLNLGKAA